MTRATLTKKTPLGTLGTRYGTANAADLTMTAANSSDKEQFVASGKDIVIAHNTGAGARTVTITSSVDSDGRTGDIATYSLGAGEYGVFGPFDLDGWVQTDGKVYLQAEHSEVLFGVVDLSNF